MSVKTPKFVKIILLIAAIGIYVYIYFYFRNVTIENVVSAFLYLAIFCIIYLVCEFVNKKD